ncbi:DUF5060 domain-containing protein [bacterium]|nr:DUF5060 domain-containing protein [FCB group bacterium]MBL7191050.1 DUF5060 domain-containing protein [bacterium]
MLNTLKLFLFVLIIISLLNTFETRYAEAADNSFIRDFAANSDTAGKYEKYEISFRLGKDYRNPFDPQEIDIQAHFITPGGDIETWPAFWFQDYDKETKTREVSRRGRTKVVTRDFFYSKGAQEWRIRYSPSEIGEYKYFITIVEGRSHQTYRYPEDDSMLIFNSVESNSKGFITVSGNDPNYFAYNDGEGFFPCGHGPEVDEKRLREFRSYNMNIVQTEFSDVFRIEHKRVGEYDLERAYRADEILKSAEEMGIYLQVVFESWPFWAEDKEQMAGNARWEENPYNSVIGGFLSSPGQFDNDEQAKNAFKNRLRHCIARWGYSPNVFCWQLWGEYDMRFNMAYQEGRRYFNERDILEWHHEMAGYIKGWDKRRMTTTAEGEPQSISPKLWSLENLDYITVHAYNHPIDLLLPKKLDEYWEMNPGKPIFIQEYGPEALLGTLNLSLEACRAGYHNPLWISVMMKCAGAPMKWTWYGDEREEVMNLDEDYRVMRQFFQGSDLANSGIKKLRINDLTPKKHFRELAHRTRNKERVIRKKGNYSPVEIMGIGNSRKAYIWIHDIRHNLYEIQYQGYRPQVITGVEFQINDMDDGQYTVEFWDTRTGSIIQTQTTASSQGRLIIEAPGFKADIAVKAVKAG